MSLLGQEPGIQLPVFLMRVTLVFESYYKQICTKNFSKILSNV